MLKVNKHQKILLLKYARKSIADYLEIDLRFNKSDLADPIFQKKFGLFVTIHTKENLRGCIGYVSAFKNLLESLKDLSLAAAFKDFRFNPLTVSEFYNIDLEISLLSSLVQVQEVSEIVIGQDGLFISQEDKSGLLLPQVATKYNWDLITFLENTCLKAGLEKNFWKLKDVKIEKFSAQIFAEKELGII